MTILPASPPQPNGVKSARCEVYPWSSGYSICAEFENWDPEKDGQASLFEEILRVKFGKDNIHDFGWRRFPPNTRLSFRVPYPVGDRLGRGMYTLTSDAIFEYSGDAKIRTTVYHA